MKCGKRLIVSMFCISLGMLTLEAKANELSALPLPTDARVQQQLTNKLPAVTHYFSRQSQAELVAFYQQQLGAPVAQKTVGPHLQLYYQRNDQRLRIVISEQNGWRDVSLMLQ